MSSINTETKQKIETWFEQHKDEMICDLGKVIAVNSVRTAAEDGAPFGKGPREALARAAAMLESRGLEVNNFEDIIITADIGPQPPVMGILAHLDVVDAGDGWNTDPYEMAIKDGKIYGRGTVDNKGPAIAAMYAMFCARDLCPKLKSGARLILGSGEETGCTDIGQYISKNEAPPNVFTPDADYPVVNTEKGRAAVFFGTSWEKDVKLPRVVSLTGGKTINIVPNRAEAVVEGFTINQLETYCMISSAQTGAKIAVSAGEAGLTITAEGTSTHAATPDLGVNAQTAILDMLSAIPFADSKAYDCIKALNRLFPHRDYYGKALGVAMEDEISGKLTLSFGVMRLTEYEFAGNFDSRTPACADKVDLMGMIREALDKEGIAITNSNMSTCHHTPGDSLFIRTLLGIYEDYTGNAGECLAIGGQTYVHNIEGGVAFGCEMPGIENHIHGANEFIGVEQLVVSAKMFAHTIIEMCGN